MSLDKHGTSISTVEITQISSHGIWLLANGREFFLAYEEFPWFRESSVNKILNVKEISSGHFYWPELDVDLTEDIILHVERFPLKAMRISSDQLNGTN